MQVVRNAPRQVTSTADATSHRPSGAAPDSAVRKAEALRVLGTLAAGMAHDLRNVLNGMFLQVQTLERADLHTDVAESVARLRQDVLVGAELLDRVCIFASEDFAGCSGAVDKNDVLAEACELAELGAPALGSARTTLRREPRPARAVSGRRGELVSAVLNLILNAVDATPCGGEITVRTGSTDEDTWIEVEDDGPGIPEEIEARMFEPFFTTKGGAGAGLGLASVADCMRLHGGSVHVRTAPGRGTRIALVLPSAAELADDRSTKG